MQSVIYVHIGERDFFIYAFVKMNKNLAYILKLDNLEITQKDMLS